MMKAFRFVRNLSALFSSLLFLLLGTSGVIAQGNWPPDGIQSDPYSTGLYMDSTGVVYKITFEAAIQNPNPGGTETPALAQ